MNRPRATAGRALSTARIDQANGDPRLFAGRVALITGARHGIGAAAVPRRWPR